MRVLVVAEKNSVAKAIATYLAEGKVVVKKYGNIPIYLFRRGSMDYASIGLRGHLLDFDFESQYNNWRSIEPGELLKLEPLLVIRPENVGYVKAMLSLAQGSDMVILALDSDVEGEAIAYETMLLIRLRKPTIRFRRALFSAVTKRDIERAFNNLTDINPNWVKKVFTRMMLDLKYGSVFTRLLTLSAKSSKAPLNRGEFLSYGPCQTPVLNLVVQRAIERENFKPETFYRLRITIEVNGKLVKLESVDKYKTVEEAQAALAKVKRGPVVVKEALSREVRQNPPKPLDTVELERRASRFLNIRSKQALDIAEELYRRGYISYPRTETDIYPPTLDLKGILRELAKVPVYSGYAGRLLRAGQLKPTAGKSTDNAHPPIHPVQGIDKAGLMAAFRNVRYWLIYDLVARHFLATLSPPATIEEQVLTIDAGGVLFKVSGLRVVDEGYLAIYPFERPKDNPLPISGIKPRAPVTLREAEVVKKKTSPPPYLSESELLRLMKKYGIGTDATMQDHIHTNVKRRYMRIVKGQCIPTPLGKALIGSLAKYAPTLIDPEFRARMEKALSMIQYGKATPQSVRANLESEALKVYQLVKPHEGDIGRELANALRSLVGKAGG